MAKVRTVQEINRDYNQKVATLGHLQWQLEKIPQQMDDIRRQLRVLDNEADQAAKVEIKAEQEKTAKALAAQKAKANGAVKPASTPDKIDQGDVTPPVTQ